MFRLVVWRDTPRGDIPLRRLRPLLVGYGQEYEVNTSFLKHLPNPDLWVG